MTKPHVYKPSEDDITELSTPISPVSHKSIIEEPPFDDEDTKQSRPKTDIASETSPKKPFSDDDDTMLSPPRKRGESKG